MSWSKEDEECVDLNAISFQKSPWVNVLNGSRLDSEILSIPYGANNCLMVSVCCLSDILSSDESINITSIVPV